MIHVDRSLPPDVQDRLDASPRSQAVRERMRSFLIALLNGDHEVEVSAGHAAWGVVEGTKRGRNVLRMFPKKGVVQISNLVPDSRPGDYGEDVVLSAKGEWAFAFSAAGTGEEDLARCASDVLAHMAGRRIRQGSKSPPDGRVRLAQDRQWRRSRLPASVRFAILVRDSYTCQYCGRAAPDVVLQIDHRTPIALGGGDEMDNLVTACVDCNLGKGARHVT